MAVTLQAETPLTTALHTPALLAATSQATALQAAAMQVATLQVAALQTAANINCNILYHFDFSTIIFHYILCVYHINLNCA